MKRNLLYSLLLLSSALVGFTSCNDDEFGDTIFPEVSDKLDPTSATFPLDTFLMANYLIPYNMRFDYKMSDTEVNMEYNLIPASYEKSVDMAVLTKYLWYDVYEAIIDRATGDARDEFFMKRYGPKMIMLVGSPAINEASGTEERGLAEGGVKITLYAVNELDVNNMNDLNDLFFRTMHHEFNHILNQSVAMPDDFQEISSGSYDPMNWQTKEDIVARTSGFITAYASKDYNEDFVEVIANYVVSTPEQWEEYLVDATRGYEEVDIDAIDINTARQDGTFIKITETTVDGKGRPSVYKILRYTVERDENGTPLRDEEGNLIYVDSDALDGRALIEQKLAMCREYLMTYFAIDMDDLRREVLGKMYVVDADGNPVMQDDAYINKLLQPTVSDPTVTVIDSLRQQVTRFEDYAEQLQNQQQ